MARLALNLNLVATLAMGGATKLRVRAQDGVLMIKPTDRVCGKALPRGEKLVKLSKRNPRRASSLVKFSVRGTIPGLGFGPQAGDVAILAPAKHGWMTVSLINEDGAAVAGRPLIKVSNS